MFNFFKKAKSEKPIVISSCVFNCPRSTSCPKWVVLDQTITVPGSSEKKIISTGRCSEAWLPIILVEINQSLMKLLGSQEIK